MADETTALILGALMPGVRGPVVEPWLAEAIRDGVESVCLFGDAVGSPDRTRETTAALRSVAPDVLIAVDEESGEVTRVEARAGSSFLSPLALGAIDAPGVTRASARLVGLLLREVGIDWTLAPVIDVNVDPRNPVIGVRSFGTDAGLVAEQGAAMIEGLQDTGVLACAKHFPGHGDTHVDSHESLPVLDASRDDLDLRELVPFHAAVQSGVASVMTGHLLVPALDDAPASLSHEMTTTLLRGELAFPGVVITDAIEMGAVSGPGRSELGQAAVAAIRAGADVVCIGADDQEQSLATCRDAVRRAVDTGEIDVDTLRESARRRQAMRAGRSQATTADRVTDVEVVAAGAPRSVTVSGNPVLTSDRVDVLRVSAHPGYAAGQTGWGVARPLAALGRDVRQLASDEGVPTASDRSLVVEVRDAWKDEALVALLEAVLDQRPDAVVVDVGWPQPVSNKARGWITTRGTGRLSSALAASALAGVDPEATALAVLTAAGREIA